MTGGLFAGDINSPFANSATIRLFGDRSTPSVTVSGVQLGSKVLAVFGTMRLCGMIHPRTWTNLVVTAVPGDTKIQVRGLLSWPSGSEIVISSTSFDPDETETVAIVSNTWLTEGVTVLVINKPLQHYHISEKVTEASKWERVEAEVALLTRTITIESGESGDEAVIVEGKQPQFNVSVFQEFGVRVMIIGGVLPDLSQDYPANVTMQYVRFRVYGQANFPRHDGLEIGAPGFLRAPRDMEPVIIQGCSFSLGLHRAIGVREIIKNVVLRDNVVFQPKRAGVVMKWWLGGGRHVVTGNLVINLQVPTEYTLPGASQSSLWDVAIGDAPFTIPAGYQCETSSMLTFAGNAVGGSHMVGFLMEPDVCENASPVMSSNTAHTCAFGFVLTQSRVNEGPPRCGSVRCVVAVSSQFPLALIPCVLHSRLLVCLCSRITSMACMSMRAIRYSFARL